MLRLVEPNLRPLLGWLLTPISLLLTNADSHNQLKWDLICHNTTPIATANKIQFPIFLMIEYKGSLESWQGVVYLILEGYGAFGGRC